MSQPIFADIIKFPTPKDCIHSSDSVLVPITESKSGPDQLIIEIEEDPKCIFIAVVKNINVNLLIYKKSEKVICF